MCVSRFSVSGSGCVAPFAPSSKCFLIKARAWIVFYAIGKSLLPPNCRKFANCSMLLAFVQTCLIRLGKCAVDFTQSLESFTVFMVSTQNRRWSPSAPKKHKKKKNKIIQNLDRIRNRFHTILCSLVLTFRSRLVLVPRHIFIAKATLEELLSFLVPWLSGFLFFGFQISAFSFRFFFSVKSLSNLWPHSGILFRIPRFLSAAVMPCSLFNFTIHFMSIELSMALASVHFPFILPWPGLFLSLFQSLSVRVRVRVLTSVPISEPQRKIRRTKLVVTMLEFDVLTVRIPHGEDFRLEIDHKNADDWH